ncbi:MAG: DNA repair protein RecO [Erysipelotrichaceae bacterium]|nr:DNA repair protein RecO [Erysipelotrichaceae bacterium]MDY5252265.1 DNA repair protein RecO [Erysipelotrichaceae bacterium]
MKLIIFKQIDYRDNDLIVNAINEHDQKVSFLIKGAKKPTSKSMAYTNLANIYEFVDDPKGKEGIQRFTGGELIRSNHRIMNSLLKIACLNCVLELVDRLYQEEAYYPGFFAKLAQVIEWIDKDEHELLALGLFWAYACELLGIKPQVDGCVICASSKVVALAVDEGGFVCQKHHRSTDILALDIEGLRTFRYLNKASLQDYDKLKALTIDQPCLHGFNRFFQLHAAIKLNSYEFLESIIKSAIN